MIDDYIVTVTAVKRKEYGSTTDSYLVDSSEDKISEVVKNYIYAGYNEIAIVLTKSIQGGKQNETN